MGARGPAHCMPASTSHWPKTRHGTRQFPSWGQAQTWVHSKQYPWQLGEHVFGPKGGLQAAEPLHPCKSRTGMMQVIKMLSCFPAWHLLASPTSSTAAPLLRPLQPTGLPPRGSLKNPQTVLPLSLGSPPAYCLGHPAPPTASHCFLFSPSPTFSRKSHWWLQPTLPSPVTPVLILECWGTLNPLVHYFEMHLSGLPPDWELLPAKMQTERDWEGLGASPSPFVLNLELSYLLLFF